MSTSKDEEQYFLLAEPLDGGTTYRLRFHSPSHPVLILNPAPPKFIRFHDERPHAAEEESSLRIVATSWKHANRRWGVVLNRADGPTASRREWEEVHMREGQSDAAFQWIPVEGDELKREELVFSQDSGGKGWMTCEWSMGMRQLFWITDELSTALPSFCQRVRIVRERVWGQPGFPDEAT